MKQADIKIGETYLTRIGQALCRVVVLSKHEPQSFSSSKRVTFTVRRADQTSPLPKRRTAASLRPIPFVQGEHKEAVIAQRELIGSLYRR